MKRRKGLLIAVIVSGILSTATMFLMWNVCFAEIEYTYEKESDVVLKILEIETTQRISETNITIANLRVKIDNLKSVKANALEYYNETVVGIDENIAFIETQIERAIELGIVEPVIEK